MSVKYVIIGCINDLSPVGSTVEPMTSGDRWIPLKKWPVTLKMFPFDDIFMNLIVCHIKGYGEPPEELFMFLMNLNSFWHTRGLPNGLQTRNYELFFRENDCQGRQMWCVYSITPAVEMHAMCPVLISRQLSPGSCIRNRIWQGFIGRKMMILSRRLIMVYAIK